MKNYFTDEHVEEIAVNAGFPVAAKHMKEELRTLMNLAVESAIGDRLMVTGEFMHNKMAEELRKLPHGLPLYSVKELEN